MHDKNGTALKEGDLVTILCRVKSCSATPEFCNVTVDTVEAMPPNEYPTTITLNTRQVVLHERPK